MKSKLLKNDNRNYFIVHNEIVEDLQPNLAALGLWVHLWSKPDNWIICYKGIMKQTGIGSNSTIKKLLGALETAGYIWKETSYFEGRPVHNWVITNNKRDSPNYRKCNRGPKSLKVDTITENVITENVITESVDKSITKGSIKGTKERKQTSAREDALMCGFDEFWKAFPKKGKCRAPAVRAWKKHKCAEFSSKVMDALAFDVRYTFKGSENRFIPDGGPWLNKERWKDDLESAAPTNKANSNWGGFHA